MTQLLMTLLIVVLLVQAHAADFQAGWEAYDRGDYATALREWRSLAEQGHARAQFYLGRMYERGQAVPKDDTEAVKWFRLAAQGLRSLAEQGHAEAQNELGLMYYSGRVVPQDDAEAAKWFRLAAEQGYARAQVDLGNMYRMGRGVPQDNDEAKSWWHKAADQGDAGAQVDLGLRYQIGWGVPHDDTEAVKWIRKAAEQGYGRAQYELGVTYAEGKGVPQDYAEAAKWYRKAAEQGYVRAQNSLLYMSHKAAEQGDAGAQYELGDMYAKGEGVLQQDFVEAMKWYRMAAEQGHAEAQLRLSAMEAREMWRCFAPTDYNKTMPLFTLARMRIDGKDVGGEVSVAGVTHLAQFQVAGLNRRWDWDYHGERGFRYALIIQPDGTGKYYDFSNSSDGSARASQFFECLLLP